jgi:hypothetical protein
LKAISQFVVHLFDLIEAEGFALRSAVRGEARRAREAATDILTGVAFLLVAVPLTLAGLALMAMGLLRWLELQVGPPLAAALTGLFVLTLAAACYWCFRSFLTKSEI